MNMEKVQTHRGIKVTMMVIKLDFKVVQGMSAMEIGYFSKEAIFLETT